MYYGIIEKEIEKIEIALIIDALLFLGGISFIFLFWSLGFSYKNEELDVVYLI